MSQPTSQNIRLQLSPQAERYVRRDAPREARMMAARGALPLPPIEIATVLFALHHDPDPEIKDIARASLESLPDSICDAVLTGPAHHALISHLAHAFGEHPGRLEKVALNQATDDTTIAFLATLPFKRIVDIVSNNQERMLRAPDIVEALGANLLTGRAVIDRILSFLGLAGKAAEGDEFVDPVSLSEAQTEEALRAVLGDEFGALASEFARERVGEVDEESIKGNLFGAIQKMTVVQKIKIARLGNKEARSLLIRDRNKIVATAVITSPKLSDNEVVSYAQSRNVATCVISPRKSGSRMFWPSVE